MGYDTEWVRKALEGAALKAELPEFPMLDYVVEAIELYLENDCPLTSLDIEELYNKIRGMLEKAGCPEIAKHLDLQAPALKISLKELASQAGETYELGFFEALMQELQDIKKFGVQEASFLHSKEAVQLLTGSKRWNKKCTKLMSEVKGFLTPYQLVS